MKNIEKILIDIEYSSSEKNKNLIKKIIHNSNQNIEHVWDKVPSLLEKLKHVKGFISISNSLNKFKISIDEIVSTEINNEFFEITKKWSDKYKIDLEYDFEKNTFYIN